MSSSANESTSGTGSALSLGVGAGVGLPNTLLGFETTGPRHVHRPPGPLWGWVVVWGVGSIGFGWSGCCPAWWWGVVFDSWIVVASISAAGRDWPSDVCLLRGVRVWWLVVVCGAVVV